MSLINEALKKAQKQRTGESPPLATLPTLGGESPRRIAKRGQPTSFNTLLLRLGIGTGILVVVAVMAVIIFRRPASEPAAPAAATPPVANTAPTPAASPTPATAPAPAASAPPQFVLNIPKPATPVAPPPVAARPSPLPAGAKQPVGQTPGGQQPATVPVAKAEPVEPAVPLKMDLKAITFIETLRVTGIRASATDSKVLMNDRVYRPGDTVEHALGIKLVGITANSLAFEDERGAKYTRQF